MNQVENKKALHVRVETKAIRNAKIAAAHLDTSLGEIVTRSLKLYYRLHIIARAEKVGTQEYILSLVKKLTKQYTEEKEHGKKT